MRYIEQIRSLRKIGRKAKSDSMDENKAALFVYDSTLSDPIPTPVPARNSAV
jgi:hypothetical protein